MNTAHAAATAATVNINVDEQLNEAESAVAQATSQLELMRGLVDQARDATEEMGAAVDSCKAQRSEDVDTDERLEAHMLSLCQQRGTEKTC
jgi:hypothetical protein